jgi:hypothetical protein
MQISEKVASVGDKPESAYASLLSYTGLTTI